MLRQGLHPRVCHLRAAHQVHRLEALVVLRKGLHPRVRHLGAPRQVYRVEARAKRKSTRFSTTNTALRAVKGTQKHNTLHVDLNR